MPWIWRKAFPNISNRQNSNPNIFKPYRGVFVKRVKGGAWKFFGHNSKSKDCRVLKWLFLESSQNFLQVRLKFGPNWAKIKIFIFLNLIFLKIFIYIKIKVRGKFCRKLLKMFLMFRRKNTIRELFTKTFHFIARKPKPEGGAI